MKYIRKPKVLVPNVITFVFVIIFFIVFFNKLTFISVPEKYTEVKCNIPAETYIYANTLGIPHIISDDDNSMFFALGYFHARERLWSFCQAKIICQGRMAEHYGSDYIDIDIFMRCFRLDSIANKCYENADNYTKTILNHYSDGINQYIEDNKDKLPIEFAAANFIPDEWRPQDCFLMLRYWSFVLSNNIFSDITTSNIVNKLGLKALELYPQYPTNAPYILDDMVIPFKEDTIRLIDTMLIDTTFEITSLKDTYSNGVSPVAETTYNGNIENVISKLYNLLNRQGCNLGSNSWAVTSENGSILLASDSHLPINLTPYWMQVHITSPNYNVVGLCFPGMPICLVGRNEHISWGNANMLVDDIDYFVHKFKDDNRVEYLNSKNTYTKIQTIIDTIKVKDGLEYMYYRDIIDGCPILKDKDIIDLKENSLFPKNDKNKSETNNYLTYKWTGTQITNEIGAMLNVMKARTWKQFLDGINNWNTPGLVWTFADIRGDIGVAPRSLIPIRAKDLDPRIVQPYWKYEMLWTGFIKPAELPTSYNPTKHFVFTANNNISRNMPNYISSSYSLESRAKRFYELATTSSLTEFNKIAEYNYRDAQIMQNDVVSVYAKDLLKKISHILKKHKSLLNKNETIAYNKLLTWNYSMDDNSIGASIFGMFLSKMIKNTFEDELEELYESYIYNPNIPLQKLLQLCSDPTSIWFDNVKTKDKTETLNYIVIASFKDAITELTKLYKTTNINQWQYGKFHKAHLIRPYCYFPSLNIYTDIGNYSISGGIGTINCAEWNLARPFDVVVASTMRFVADMSSDYCYTILLRGISDNAMSSHSSNQLKLFNIGAYSTLSINREVADNFSLEVVLRKK